MPKLILTVGASNSGKTTWASNYVLTRTKVVNFNRDDFRETLSPTGRLQDYKYTKAREKLISEQTFTDVKEYLEAGWDIIISDTNLNPKTRQKWKDLAEELGVTYEEKTFVEPLKTLLERNQKRDYSVPTGVIFKQFMQMQEYLGEYIYKPVWGLPQCVIVDIDGTLAHMDGIRKPYEWDKVGLDEPDTQLIEYLQDNFRIKQGALDVILFSGRDSCSRAATEMWLINNEIPYNALYMREEGVNHCDTIIKREMFDKHIKGKYNVSHVIDDRPRVVNMWLGLGLKVWAMGNQLVDF